MKRHRIGAAVVGLVVAAAGLVASPASATNTHTIDNVYHGCGECANPEDFYTHPFTDSPGNSAWKKVYWKWNPTGGVLATNECYCTHAHLTWDTFNNAECYYRSGHSGTVSNPHDHFSHAGVC